MNFIWTIEQLFVKKTEGQLSDVVINANWRCFGTDGTYSATSCGTSEFAPPTGNFTPYNELTEQQVLDWCFANGVDKTAIESNVTQQINDQINPPVVVLPLPWVPPVVVAEPVAIVDAPAA